MNLIRVESICNMSRFVVSRLAVDDFDCLEGCAKNAIIVKTLFDRLLSQTEAGTNNYASSITGSRGSADEG
jgi:hypothetical protein